MAEQFAWVKCTLPSRGQFYKNADGTPAVPGGVIEVRKLGFNETRELETIEARIHDAEAIVEKLSAEAQSPTHASDAGRLSELFRELTAAQSEVERLFARWQELEALKSGAD